MSEYVPTEYERMIHLKYLRDVPIIRQSLYGITAHATALAASGSRDQLAELRKLVDFMSTYWFGDDEVHDREFGRQYLDAFDVAVHAAESTGQCAALDDNEKRATVLGLDIHMEEMVKDDDYPNLKDFRALTARLRSEWGLAVQTQQMGGMVLS